MKKTYGWRPDKPDVRDRYFRREIKDLPREVDLREYFPEAVDQGELGSCTANAIAGAIEFDQIKQQAYPIFLPSRLFIYYNERVIEDTVESDAGAEIRDGIKSVNRQGACSERDWPYDIEKFTQRPPQSCFENAQLHRTLEYRRVSQTLADMKGCLAKGFPFVVGFTCYESFESDRVERTGVLDLPKPNERSLGGHAVLAVGYGDAVERFLVRNSWGKEWGLPTVDSGKGRGYFSIPYEYLTNPDLAGDFWTIRRVQN